MLLKMEFLAVVSSQIKLYNLWIKAYLPTVMKEIYKRNWAQEHDLLPRKYSVNSEELSNLVKGTSRLWAKLAILFN